MSDQLQLPIMNRAIPENAQKWVAGLRSGKYPQGFGYLNKDGQFCCLGVGCEVALENGWKGARILISASQPAAYADKTSDPQTRILPLGVVAWLGLRRNLPCGIEPNRVGQLAHAWKSPSHDVPVSSLTIMNDWVKPSLSQIADFIEQHPDLLFEGYDVPQIAQAEPATS